MNAIFRLISRLRGSLNAPKATPETDPQQWLNTLLALPDPDPILRGMGRAETVYNSIIRDSHVIGDVRSIRGNFRSHDYRLVVGNEGDPLSAKALELCQAWMRQNRPAGANANGVQHDWLEVMWQMTAAILYGYRAHELVWTLQDGKYMPGQVLDRPNRRFQFGADGSPLLISRGSGLIGQPVEPHEFVISRHMADATNPYGIALLSAAFWPWTFKTGGWRYFVKYCERHGLPWPIGRYPQGTDDSDIDKLEDALAEMLEAGYVVAQEGTSLELLVPTTTGSGALPQENLIDRCNREISKALTGQAMVAELQKVGARAASETASDRQSSINDADRDIASAGMGQIFSWLTRFNFGDGVAPPALEFFRHEKAGKERAETYEVAARLGARPSKSALLDELGIPEATDDADALLVPAKSVTASSSPTSQPLNFNAASLAGFEFAKAAGMTEDEAIALATEAADQAIEDHMIAPVAQMLAQFEEQGKTLAEFSAALGELIGQKLDDEALREVLERSLTYAALRGAATRAA